MRPDADRIGLRHAVAGIALLAMAGPAMSQETGRLLSFGTSIGFVAEDNPDLIPDGGEGSVDAILGLDLLLRRATRVQSLTLTGNAQLRNDDGGNASDALAQSNVGLSYRRPGADTALTLDASLRRDQVDYLDPLAIDFDDDLIIDEIRAVGRTGTRLNYRLDTTLELRRRAPFGITLSAGLSGVDYSDTNDATLTDQERYRAGIGLRFDFNPVLRGTLDVDYEDFQGETSEAAVANDREELSIGGRLARRLPAGSIGLAASVTSVEDGERATLALTRAFATPLWDVDAEIGATRQTTGDVVPVAEINVARGLPTGQVSANLRRSVRTDNEDGETVLTAVSANYAREVNRTLDLSMGLSYVSTDPADDSSTESFASARLDLSRTLTEDWSVNLGLEHRAEDDGDIGRASSNRVSLSLRRAFVTPR